MMSSELNDASSADESEGDNDKKGLVSDRKKWSERFLPHLILRKKGQYDLELERNDNNNLPSQDMVPKDRFYLVYICMLMGGVGFLTPWTAYIGAIDYFFYYYKRDFPSVSVAIPVTYLVVTFFAATLNIALVKRFGIHSRITFGYVMFIVSLLLIPLLDVGIHNCTIPVTVSFYLTLITIAMVGLGSGVQQSSYYGLSSMLPRRYTQAVMAGESVAGVVESSLRIITKVSTKSEEMGGIVFFVISLVIIVVCVICHCYIRTNKMVKFYMRKCQSEAQGNGEDERKRENLDQQHLLSVNNVENLDSADENVLLSEECADVQHGRENVSEDRDTHTTLTSLKRVLKSNFKVHINVTAQIWPLMAAIFLNYFITLLLFPGLVSIVQDCTLGSWAPVILVSAFNVVDAIIKWFALLPIIWSPKMLLLTSTFRLIFIPLILLCVSPSPTHPVLGANVFVFAVLFTLLLGLSNGYLGSLPMINVAAHIKEEKNKELAGTMMTWVLLVGLLVGSVCAYALTPLTNLAPFHRCSNDTMADFSSCNHYSNTTV